MGRKSLRCNACRPPKQNLKDLHNNINKSVISERWSITGLLLDPVRLKKVILLTELGFSGNGDLHVIRCIKIFEDYTVQIYIEDVDKTSQFKVKSIVNEIDAHRAMSEVASAKICQGIKDFSTKDWRYFPEVVRHGSSWCSRECVIVIAEKAKTVCTPCGKINNALRRRRIRDEQKKQGTLIESRITQTPLSIALYSMLRDLQMEAIPRKMNNRGPVVFSEEHGIYLPTELLNRSTRQGFTQSTVDNDCFTFSINTQNTVVLKEDGSSTMYEPNSGIMKVSPKFSTSYGDDSNVFTEQNDSVFTMTEGQEYELIGMVDPLSEHAQLMTASWNSGNNIEFNDQTLAKLMGEGQNFHDVYSQHLDSINVSTLNRNIVVSELDPNDQNIILNVIETPYNV